MEFDDWHSLAAEYSAEFSPPRVDEVLTSTVLGDLRKVDDDTREYLAEARKAAYSTLRGHSAERAPMDPVEDRVRCLLTDAGVRIGRQPPPPDLVSQDLAASCRSPVRSEPAAASEANGYLSAIRAFWGKPNTEFVEGLYRTLLGREPDPSGFADHVATLAAGESRERLVFAVATSPEATRRGLSLSWLPGLAELKVPGDSGGPAVSPGADPIAAIKSLWNRPDQEFVAGLYQVILKRQADEPGMASHLAALRAGSPRMEVVRGIAGSEEASLLGNDRSWLRQLDDVEGPLHPQGNGRALHMLGRFGGLVRRAIKPEKWKNPLGMIAGSRTRVSGGLETPRDGQVDSRPLLHERLLQQVGTLQAEQARTHTVLSDYLMPIAADLRHRHQETKRLLEDLREAQAQVAAFLSNQLLPAVSETRESLEGTRREARQARVEARQLIADQVSSLADTVREGQAESARITAEVLPAARALTKTHVGATDILSEEFRQIGDGIRRALLEVRKSVSQDLSEATVQSTKAQQNLHEALAANGSQLVEAMRQLQSTVQRLKEEDLTRSHDSLSREVQEVHSAVKAASGGLSSGFEHRFSALEAAVRGSSTEHTGGTALTEIMKQQVQRLQMIADTQQGLSNWLALMQVKITALAQDVREIQPLPVSPEGLPEPRIVDPQGYAARIGQMSDGIRLNLGCGEVVLPQYINIDFRELPGVDIVADVRRLPFDDGIVAELYSAHLVEHFRRAHLLNSVLPYWKRLLRPGGVLRVVCPNWEAVLARHHAEQMSLADLTLLTFGAQDYRGDDHLAMYTPATLIETLTSAGFSDIEIAAEARQNGLCPEMEIVARRSVDGEAGQRN